MSSFKENDTCPSCEFGILQIFNGGKNMGTFMLCKNDICPFIHEVIGKSDFEKSQYEKTLYHIGLQNISSGF